MLLIQCLDLVLYVLKQRSGFKFRRFYLKMSFLTTTFDLNDLLCMFTTLGKMFWLKYTSWDFAIF